VLVATLLADPQDATKRRELYKRLAGSASATATSGKEIEGGLLRWGSENEPDIVWFRETIKKQFGRPPRVLDPFSGGGAIPLEAMRLGCETFANDINPVAWFVLKCTLDFPQRFALVTEPLPDFAWSATGTPLLEACKPDQGDLAAHVRAWGHWVFAHAKERLARFYPKSGDSDIIAYLWARTVVCKNCRIRIPLLKTRWLCRTAKKAVALHLQPASAFDGLNMSVVELSDADRARYDATGTMNDSGVKCPCCPAQITMAELRAEGIAGRLGTIMTAVISEASVGKSYRSPSALDRQAADSADASLPELFADIPFGIPSEPLPSSDAPGIRVPLYGFDKWAKLFTSRQLYAIGTFLHVTRLARNEMRTLHYTDEFANAVLGYLACAISKNVDKNSTLVEWQPHTQKIGHTLKRFALPMSWDFAETNFLSSSTGNYIGAVEWIANILDKRLSDERQTTSLAPSITAEDAQDLALPIGFDVVITDPPYYGEIPYSDVMDLFYVWLRRLFHGLGSEFAHAFEAERGPKFDVKTDRGELIDDASRFGGDGKASKDAYERGMTAAFVRARQLLAPDGRAVIVFANKKPDAWETLVASVISAGFVVEASWPIATEMTNRTRALSSAALASSIWLVCRKRDEKVTAGWDSVTQDEMRAEIALRLQEFWDAGIRGPDFVWSAIGPALEAYSKYPRVRKVDDPDQHMSVSEFLSQVRREVVGFAAARVLNRSESIDDDLDAATIYYLLHRHDFQFEPVPVGASILYAISCNLRDSALVEEYDLLDRVGGATKKSRKSRDAGDALDDGSLNDEQQVVADESTGKKNVVLLKAWDRRMRQSLGEDTLGRRAPLIDQIHRLMRLWKSGDVSKVNEYIAARGLSSDQRAREVIQAIIELSERGTQERSILEAISNHLGGARPVAEAAPVLF
jgi:adenine-specific DNA methylase